MTLSRVQTAVLKQCQTTDSVNGLDFATLCALLHMQATEGEVRMALLTLGNEGLVYTTISDDHWMAS